MTKDYREQLDELFIDSVSEKTLIQAILITIESIGPEVTWDHFESYLASKIPAHDVLFDNLQAYTFSVFQESEISQEIQDNNLVKLTFNNPQITQAFFDFTQHVFPIIKSEYPQINNNEIILTDDQLFFCRRGAKLKAGDLPSDFLNDYFLKTLRADKHDFSDKFIKGLIPTPDGTRRLQNLRPKGRLPYTIAGDGSVISRTSRLDANTSHKDGFTQIQSCTHLDNKALTPAFGFDKERNPKLYGILTHRNDLIISRFLLNDGGTVCRPFDAEATQPGERRASDFRNPANPHLFHPNECEKFKAENIKARRKKQKTNETLARMRFNIFRGMICICADDFEARLLAYDFSEELLEHYTEYANSKGLQLNPKFKIPIVFYLKMPEPAHSTRFINKLAGNEALHKVFRHTRKMRGEDIKEANTFNAFYCNRKQKYNSNNYEFLLGLETLSAELLLETTENNIPLAAEMMEKGYTRMLLRLIRRTRKQNAPSTQGSRTLSEIVFESLAVKGNDIHYDIIIPQLIIAEEFKLADKLLDFSKLKIDNLKYEDIKLSEYILVMGNPRHYHYMGLDDMLIKAADQNYWVTIRLCLKEFDNISSATIDLLFSKACKGKYINFNEPDIVFLLKRKKVSKDRIAYEISHAIGESKWETVALICRYLDEHSCEVDLAAGVFLAVKQQKPILAALMLTKKSTNSWRETAEQKYFFKSALLYAIKYEYNELIPQLIDYEESYQDQYTDARRGLAIDLAHVENNTVAIALFSNNRIANEFILLNDVNLSICHYVFEAFFANQPEIAEYRLKSLMKQCDFSMANFKNIIQTMMFFYDSFQSALIYFRDLINFYEPISIGEFTFKKHLYIKEFFECVVKLSLKYSDISLLRFLQNTLHDNFNVDKLETEDIIINTALEIISSTNVETILSLIKTSDFPGEWENSIFEKFKSLIPDSHAVYNKSTALLFYLILTMNRIRNDITLDASLLRNVFKHAVATSNTTLTHYLLNDTQLNTLLKEELFLIAFEHSSSRYFSYLLKNYQFTINADHIKLSHFQNRSYWKATVLLQELTKSQYNNTFSHWDYFYLWSFCGSGEFWSSEHHTYLKLFALILDHNVIKHFTLLNLLILLINRYSANSLTDSWPNLQAILQNKYVKDTVSHYTKHFIGPINEKTDYHQTLLATLNDYFDGTDNIPEGDIIDRTYQSVLRILKQNIPKSFLMYFFSNPEFRGFTNNVYDYLKEVDDLLNQHKTVPLTHDSEDVEALHKFIDDIFPDKKLNFC